MTTSAVDQVKASNGVGTRGDRVLEAFRTWGYLEANLDPLGLAPRVRIPELAFEGEAAASARSRYCGTIGVEFMHIGIPERRAWIQQRMETDPEPVPGEFILERLVRAKVFEQLMHARYPGTKRYSLEGVVALLPLLDEILEAGAAEGAIDVVLAMAHRGRLNVMVHIVGRSPEEVFAAFEDVDPSSVLGGGDVKYHLGATGTYRTRSGEELLIHLVSNPSHLEAVDPVAIGRSRAKQTRLGEGGLQQVLPIVLHGDAAFAGQGIVAETLNMSILRGFDVGGALHVIVNNLIGFTTQPREAQSSCFSSDIAKRLPVPVFHVNAEDPDAVVRVGRMAAAYRYAFASDVVIDLIGFRQHGHSEVDDPSITQPRLYRKITSHPHLYEIYGKTLGKDPSPIVEQVHEELGLAQERASKSTRAPAFHTLPEYWSGYYGGPYRADCEVDTGVPHQELVAIAHALSSVPGDFHIHPKVKRLLDQRVAMVEGNSAVDHGMAEALAFGALLKEGVPIRMSGQDTRRGTFNQRHAVLIDVEDEREDIPLARLARPPAWFEIYNSALSEASVLGFEYGFSRDYPEALVLWEAQFGDFANGAQLIIDQFISAGEDKWHLLSGVVLLLPHGYEGQGPEHSSARIERYLQLAAEDNMQVCQPSSAAQYFHLLRRQALRRWRKPLVVFTPKSMLRHADAASPIEEFSRPRFETVLDDPAIENAERILLCTGKISHELRRERARLGKDTTAIVVLEQLYPFPEKRLIEILGRHTQARELVWVQEEPANMGALSYVHPVLQRLSGGRAVRSIKRSASASPATGSQKAHAMEQKTLLTLAFS
jgi:2-oxoglutarate dehydrogenase E1 component